MPLNLEPDRVTEKTHGRTLVDIRWQNGRLQKCFSEKVEEYEGRRYLRGYIRERWEDVPGEPPGGKGIEAAAPEPVRRAYSREELSAELSAWMVREFGHPIDYGKDPDQQDRWYRDNGLIYHFICDHFPDNPPLPLSPSPSLRTANPAPGSTLPDPEARDAPETPSIPDPAPVPPSTPAPRA